MIVRLYRYCINYHTPDCKTIKHDDVYREIDIPSGYRGNIAKKWRWDNNKLVQVEPALSDKVAIGATINLEKIYKPCRLCIK